jgi:hypothetical protein
MLLPLALVAALHSAPAADSLAGAWKITGDIMGNPVNAVCTFKQDAEKLSGSCEGQETPGQKYDLIGEAKAGQVHFQYAVDYQGQKVTVAYAGTLTSPKELKGTVEAKEFGASGTFTAVPAAKP